MQILQSPRPKINSMRKWFGWHTYKDKSKVPSAFVINLNDNLSSNKSSAFSMKTHVFETKTAFPKNGIDSGKSAAYLALSLNSLLSSSRKFPSKTFRRMSLGEKN